MSETKTTKNYVNVEWLKNLAQETKHIKQRSYQLMQIQTDSEVLDLGCGPAIDTIPLSKFIGDKGRVVGVDYDPEMLEEADQEVAKAKITKNIKHILGNVKALPFHDGEFDRVHAERLFQVFPETVSMQIFNEINRVLKSKGRLVLVDMDIATLSVNFSDSEFERKVINHFALKLRPNGFAGRQIFEILKKNNYKELSLEFMHHSIGNLTSAYFSEWIIKGTLDAKVVTKEEADKWRQELTRKTEEGTFLAYLSNVLVTGIKP